jgi:hypothetical protein
MKKAATSAAVVRPSTSLLSDRFSGGLAGRTQSTGMCAVLCRREAAPAPRRPRNGDRSDVRFGPCDNFADGAKKSSIPKNRMARPATVVGTFFRLVGCLTVPNMSSWHCLDGLSSWSWGRFFWAAMRSAGTVFGADGLSSVSRPPISTHPRPQPNPPD